VASKGALYGLTKARAREHGARVNAVSPGGLRSEAEDGVFRERLQQHNEWVLDRRSVKARIFPEHCR
jgi:NAD(P)-dependent dehydrogenase (short-subunit alcohol dehydrogenase family)